MTENSKINLRVQKWIAFLAVVLFLIKIIAWYITKSVSILTDALESIVNILAAFLGVYSLTVSAKPRDKDHPYGHGKVEFISSAVEGTAITIAGLYIIYEAIRNLFHPHIVQKLDFGIFLICITAVLNFLAGAYCESIGKRNNSIALVSSGKHLKSDTYTTAGIIIGLILLYITKIKWIDSASAILFSVIIIYNGISIISSSIAGIMDKADEELLAKMVMVLNSKRRINWIDLHNMRIVKYGPTLHIDCHLTVPWYFNVTEAHQEVDELYKLVNENFSGAVEISVHTDGCLPPLSCQVCHKDCHVRQSQFVKTIVWTTENVRDNHKHNLETV